MTLRVFAAAAALGVLSGCSAADRAVLAAPRCADADAAPQPVRHAPGRVVAVAPAFSTPEVTGLIPGWDDVVSVASTGHTVAAVHADGTVSVYGLGHLGSLGDGVRERHVVTEPQPVPGITDAVSVHPVGSAFVVVRADGTVLMWGDAFLANGGVRGAAQAQPSPVPVAGASRIVDVATGDLQVLALRADGQVTGWGINLTDVLGDRQGTTVRTLRDRPGLLGIANAGGAGIGATGAGEVCAWGSNVHGLLGAQPRGGQTPGAVRVGALSGIVQVAAGTDVAFALDEAGAVWAWGRGAQGVLGDGDASDHVSADPRPVPGLPPIRWIGAYGLTAYAIDRDGGLWAWGSGLVVGELAAGAVTAPIRIDLPGPAAMVSGNHVLLAD
ncbi:RCC1 domain-containing protein [Pseudonocardia hispaniensis]|uniref:RCC1 domain-containing protein n=1 Tax=Pseudonocardia hispaniensis TaxID=904933 RepID=A0ABW1J332_9PSEU